VVQEYERAVIFRLGRLLKGGARGPGIFFIVPCIDTYRKIDLRTVSFDVPPQEVSTRFQPFVFFFFWYILFKKYALHRSF
jgi:erythrocyte band 7 integral membrane protein